jgi:hypothetical protein
LDFGVSQEKRLKPGHDTQKLNAGFFLVRHPGKWFSIGGYPILEFHSNLSTFTFLTFTEKKATDPVTTTDRRVKKISLVSFPGNLIQIDQTPKKLKFQIFKKFQAAEWYPTGGCPILEFHSNLSTFTFLTFTEKKATDPVTTTDRWVKKIYLVSFPGNLIRNDQTPKKLKFQIFEKFQAAKWFPTRGCPILEFHSNLSTFTFLTFTEKKASNPVTTTDPGMK